MSMTSMQDRIEERGLAASIHNPAAAMRVCQATARGNTTAVQHASG